MDTDQHQEDPGGRVLLRALPEAGSSALAEWKVEAMHGRGRFSLWNLPGLPHFLLELVTDVFQVSEQQLKEAVAQAVEGVKFGKDRHQWSLEGKGSGEGFLEWSP